MRYSKPHMFEALKDHVLEEIIEPANVNHPRLSKGGPIRVFRMGLPDTNIYSSFLFFTPIGISIGGDIKLGAPTNHRGIWSDYSYGLEWFASDLDEHYLCSKFFSTVWQRELAAEWCRDHAREILEGHYDEKTERSALRDEVMVQKDEIQDCDRSLKEWEASDDPEKKTMMEPIESDRSDAVKALAEAEDKLRVARKELADKFERLAKGVEWEYYGDDAGRFRDALYDLGYSTDGDHCPGYDYPAMEAGWLSAIQKKFAELYAKRAESKVSVA